MRRFCMRSRLVSDGYNTRYWSHSGWNVLPVSYLYSGKFFIAFATDVVSSPGSAA